MQTALGPSSSLGPPRVVALAEIGSQQLYFDIATQPAIVDMMRPSNFFPPKDVKNTFCEWRGNESG